MGEEQAAYFEEQATGGNGSAYVDPMNYEREQELADAGIDMSGGVDIEDPDSEYSALQDPDAPDSEEDGDDDDEENDDPVAAEQKAAEKGSKEEFGGRPNNDGSSAAAPAAKGGAAAAGGKGKKNAGWKQGDKITIKTLSDVWAVAVRHSSTKEACAAANRVVDGFLSGATAGVGPIVMKVLGALRFATGKTLPICDTIGQILQTLSTGSITKVIPLAQMLEKILNTGPIVALLTPVLTVIVPLMEQQNKKK